MPVLTCEVENLAGVASGEALRFEVDDIRASGVDTSTLIGNDPIVRVYPVNGVYTTPSLDPGPVVMAFGPYRKRFTVPDGPGPYDIVPLLLLESVAPPPTDKK